MAMAPCFASRPAVPAPLRRPIAPDGACCKPEEDPFLLLESTLRSVQEILLRRRGLPLRRTWIEEPYGEEEICWLEEEVIPALQRCLERMEEIDQCLLAEQELLRRCRLEVERDALAGLKVAML